MQDGKFHPHTDYKKGVRKSRDQKVKTKGVRVRMRRYNVCEPFLEDPASHKPDDTKHTNQVMYSLGDESCASLLTDEEFSMLLTNDQVANTFSPIGETAKKWQQDDAFRKRIIDRAQELNEEQKKVDRKARDCDCTHPDLSHTDLGNCLLCGCHSGSICLSKEELKLLRKVPLGAKRSDSAEDITRRNIADPRTELFKKLSRKYNFDPKRASINLETGEVTRNF